ncbi:endopeptidase La [Bdellovibrio bacteriovorus]|uniref:endopeptidase La n=1 Tax=Bdellovibrio bacteriovorus TaxID=959 RepID=UPI0021D38F2B|nr:endopeptidase La [Bdellovibrio bacteriovorus]UXR63413.1 endopeptidase La [Bdellovibrio bacteriovorus]
MSYVSGFVPVIPLKNSVLFPDISMPLRIGREKSISALQKALRDNHWVVLLTQKDPNAPVNGIEDLYQIGTLAKVESFRADEDGSYNIFVKAHQRVRVVQNQEAEGHLEVQTESLEDSGRLDKKTEEALLASLRQLSDDLLDLLPGNTRQIREMIAEIEDLSTLVNMCAAYADIGLQDKQEVLEITSLKDRALKLLDRLQELKERLKIQRGIRDKLQESFQQNQKESILREQMRVIREELGDNDGEDLFTKFKEKIEKSGMPTEALELARNQLKRLETSNSASPEYQMIRTHLELLTSLPWDQSSAQQEIDLEAAEKILNEDHYGLDKIKKRILQHLAVMKLRKTHQGSILLFIGPPGVGKTSLGKSIARALGKKYVRVALGGVRDDAEIRGHRRTYIGALPGRIISAIKKAGENDPVFILDEIDKLTRGFGGDPASAMLEVLDPEQNNSFQDHYLDTPFDLSKVFFIATANSLEGIPLPLLDRMEVIDLSGYTIDEKRQIARNHLWPKQLAEHGLDEAQLRITDEALTKLLTHYTREAGVRDLQRKIATVCKHMSLKIIKAASLPLLVEEKDLEDIFGAERFSADMIGSLLPPGVVTGLAWTPVGGDILFIEAAQMPGQGQLLLTGQLGEVMQESAKIALSLLKSRLPILNPLLDFSKKDIHVHVPAGAIPKDGPSAGVTMLTSIASLLLNKPVDPKLAMTGEISLRGSVLPVGGIKEKVIAAHRAGVQEILLCRRNEKDLREIPEDIRKDLRFHFVEDVNDVLKITLGVDLPRWDQPQQLPPPPLSSTDAGT